MTTAIAIVTVEATGEELGAISFSGKRVTADGPVATSIVEASRRRRLDDAEIWEYLDGWSNGYLVIHEQEPTTAAGGLSGAELEEFNRLHRRDRKGRFADRIGDAISSGVAAALDEFNREQLRRYATRERGLVLPRGASVDVIKERLMKSAGKQAAGAVALEPSPLPDRAALGRKTIPQLRELAKAHGVRIPAKAKKAEIVDLLAAPSGITAKPSVHEQNIRDAYSQLATREGAWVDLTDLREKLAAKGMNRTEQDVALKQINRQPGVVLITESEQTGLTPQRRAAALKLGGQEKHLIHIEPADGVQLARQRQADIDAARARADVLIQAEELLNNQADQETMLHRLDQTARRLGVEDDPVLAKVHGSVAAGHVAARTRTAIEAAAAKLGLSKVGGEGLQPFDAAEHKMIAGAKQPKPGAMVHIVRPGYRYDRDGEDILLSKAVVEEEEATPAPQAERETILRQAVQRVPQRAEALSGGITAGAVDRVFVAGGGSYVRKTYSDPLDAPLRIRSEILGSKVLNAVGVDAPAVVQIDDHSIAMEFVPGRQGGQTGVLKAPKAVVESDTGRRIGLADALMGYRDRAGGNWIKADDGRIVPIDNDGAFLFGERAAAGNPFTSYILGRHETSPWKPRIELPPGVDLAQVRSNIEALRPEFEQLGAARDYRKVLDRFGEIEKRAVVRPGPAGRFLSSAEATRMQDGMLTANPWPDSQKNALTNYAHQNYAQVNGLLRDNEWADILTNPGDRAQIEKAIRDVHAAMRPLPQPVKVVRFIDPDILNVDPADPSSARSALNGHTFQDPGFMSTSLDPEYGVDPDRDNSQPPFTRLDIDIPAGTPAAYLDSAKGIGFEHERELLLDAGMKLRFMDVVAGPGERQLIIKAEVIR